MLIKRILKDEIFFVCLVILAIIGCLALDTFGQSKTARIFAPCSGSATVKAEVKINSGFVDLIPCPTKAVRVNGSEIAITGLASLNGLVGASQTFALGTADTASFSSATTTHTLNLPISAISGTSRTNYFPYFNAANTLAKSPFSWSGTAFQLNNTALNSQFTLDFTPNNATGRFRVGSYSTNPKNFIELDQATNHIYFSTTTFNWQNASLGADWDMQFVPNDSTGYFQVGDSTFVTNYFQLSQAGNSFKVGSQNVEFNSKDGYVRFGDNESNFNGTKFVLDDSNQKVTVTANETQISNSFAIATGSSCFGKDQQLNVSGELDLTGICGINNDSTILAIWTDVASTGTLRQIGQKIVSSAGVADAGLTISYWIINRY